MIGFDDIEYASLSDVGIRRSHNQDSYATLAAKDLEHWRSRGHLFLVADGMGAHAVGELASKIAADSIPHLYAKYAVEGAADALRKSFVEANLTIYTRGQQNREFAGMGTTGTALLLRPEGAWVGHVGDSRCYRVRDGFIEQLSFDHSLVWELAKRQGKRPEELHGVPTNVIVRSLGPEGTVNVDVEGPHPIRAGDRYVLCSDGLSGPVSDREMGAVVAALPPEEACRFLIQLANLQGGPDNITALVIQIKKLRPSDSSQDEANASATAGNKERRRRARLAVLRFVPWPLLLLGLGVGLAVLTIYLKAFEIGGTMIAFMGAAVALLGGLGGLMFQSARESQPAPKEEPTPPTGPHIYRRTSCGVEASVVQRLTQAIDTLDERIRDHNWQADWGVVEGHREAARRAQRQGDLPGAFREYCRAMLLLMEAIYRQRNKEESFKPLWDKAPA